PLGHAATFAYNAVGLLSSSTDRDGRRIDNAYDTRNQLTTQVWYDSGGTATQTLTYSYDDAGNQLTAANSAGTYTMIYDGLGRVTAVYELFGLQLGFSYDAVGNRTKVSDSLGGVLTSVYDAAGNLTSRQFTGTGGTSPLRFDQTFTALNQVSTQT